MYKTIVTPDKVEFIQSLLPKMTGLQGSTAEVGVYTGGVSKLIASSLPAKTHYCFDTFEGIPNSQEIDFHQNGEFACSLEEVMAYLSECQNIIIKKGYFPNTAVGIDGRFCLVHIDGDTYQTTKDSLEFFYPRLVPGGCMVFDDWLWDSCLGVEKALREFMDGKPEPIEQTVPNQCMIRIPLATYT